MMANHNWPAQLNKHLRILEEAAASGREVPSRGVNVPEDVMGVFNIAFGGYEKAVFLDLETTGFDPTRECITRIAFVKVRLREGKLETFGAYVSLPEGRKVPEKITTLTGISDALLTEKGKSEGEALRSFGERIGEGKTILIGHNIQFDLCFLLEGLKRQKETCADVLRKIENADYMDTLTVCRDRFPAPHSLPASLKEYGLYFESAHHALEDAGGALSLAYFLGCEKPNLADYINRFGVSPKYGLTGFEISGVRYFAQEDIIAAPEISAPRTKGKAL